MEVLANKLFLAKFLLKPLTSAKLEAGSCFGVTFCFGCVKVPVGTMFFTRHTLTGKIR
jgi:hypothetical protein